MKFSLIQDYPSSLARLWIALARREYVEKKYRSLGSTALRIQKFQAGDARIEVELERLAPVVRDRLPRWACTFVTNEQTMHHRSHWQRTSPATAEAELDIAPVGLPVHAHGVGAIVELAPALTRMTLAFDVRCELPAIGSQVARLFAIQVQDALAKDHAFTLAYLAADDDAAAPDNPRA